MDVETVCGTTNLITNNIVYNAFHQTVHFTGSNVSFFHLNMFTFNKG